MGLRGVAALSTSAIAPSQGTDTALFTLNTANMNVTTDQSFVKVGMFTNYIIRYIMAYNASVSLTLAAGGIYTAAAKGGTAIVAAAQVYSALTTPQSTLLLTLANTDLRSITPILSLTTAQGAPATAIITIFGVAVT